MYESVYMLENKVTGKGIEEFPWVVKKLPSSSFYGKGRKPTQFIPLTSRQMPGHPPGYLNPFSIPSFQTESILALLMNKAL